MSESGLPDGYFDWSLETGELAAALAAAEEGLQTVIDSLGDEGGVVPKPPAIVWPGFCTPPMVRCFAARWTEDLVLRDRLTFLLAWIRVCRQAAQAAP